MPKGFRERNRGSMDQIRRAIAVSFAVAGASAWSCGVRAQDAAVDATLAQAEGGGAATADDKAAAMGRIATTPTLTDLGPSDLIIEAATERETVKQAIFEDLLPHLKPDVQQRTDYSDSPN